MTRMEINRISGKLALLLSLIALFTVLTGFGQPPQADEGTGAHIFQLDIVALVLVLLIFFISADWSQPLRSIRPLAVPVIALVLAFAALYYLEHCR
jgi:phosphoglycerol transferase MdoB-like AlkP superfamily enzyme